MGSGSNGCFTPDFVVAEVWEDLAVAEPVETEVDEMWRSLFQS